MIIKFEKFYRKFDNYDDCDQNFKVGDIVVCIDSSNTPELEEDCKYKIKNITGPIEPKFLEIEKYSFSFNNFRQLHQNFYYKRFISLDDWNLRQTTKNFNL